MTILYTCVLHNLLKRHSDKYIFDERIVIKFHVEKFYGTIGGLSDHSRGETNLESEMRVAVLRLARSQAKSRSRGSLG